MRDKWWPIEVKCLFVGESPGKPGAMYFYDPIPVLGRDPVDVRRNLLKSLPNGIGIHLIADARSVQARWIRI